MSAVKEGYPMEVCLRIPTQLYKDLQNDRFNLPPPDNLPEHQTPLPYVILVDQVLALNDNLMKGYSGFFEKGTKQRIFNYRLSRARRVVENAFGICLSVFHVL
nr:unnamed protein product [Callosobruchus analis]